MKTSIVFLSLLSVVFGNQVFAGSDGKSLMYSITDVTLSWIDAMKVNSNTVSVINLGICLLKQIDDKKQIRTLSGFHSYFFFSYPIVNANLIV
jgi:hypothetical protein